MPWLSQFDQVWGCGMDPLSVILAAMRRRLAEGDEAGAVALAKAAAPYVHPRAAARSGRGGAGLERVEDDDLDATNGDAGGRGAGGGAGAAGEDTDEPD